MVVTGRTLIGGAAGYPEKIPPKFFFIVRRGVIIGGRSMHVANIARVAAIAGAKIFRRAFEHEHTRSPRRRAVIAAHSAALPPPTTKTSNGPARIFHHPSRILSGPVQTEQPAHEQSQTDDNASIDEGLQSSALWTKAVKKPKREKRGGDAEAEKQDQQEIQDERKKIPQGQFCFFPGFDPRGIWGVARTSRTIWAAAIKIA